MFDAADDLDRLNRYKPEAGGLQIRVTPLKAKFKRILTLCWWFVDSRDPVEGQGEADSDVALDGPAQRLGRTRSHAQQHSAERGSRLITPKQLDSIYQL